MIFKLKLIKGKCIIFVSDIDRCYRLKLFFEQFGIRSCILNSELPLNSRVHVVEEFNKHVYDIIIAADEKNEMMGDDEEPVEGETEDAEKQGDGDDAETEAKRPKKKAKKSKGGDKEYGVSRGMFARRCHLYGRELPKHRTCTNNTYRCRFQEGFRSHQLRSPHNSISLHT